MYGELRVAVVIPAHEEAELLPVTVAGLPDWVDGVIVVDDASRDATAHVASELETSRLELIVHHENQGVGGAIVTGYRRALCMGFDAVVVVGADNQMDPTEMPALLEPLVEGSADYVKGNRLGHPEVYRRMPWVRLIGNIVLTAMTRLATGYGHLRDAQCGYTAINRQTLEKLSLESLYPRYGFPNDLLAKLADIHARVVDRPVSPIYGQEQSGLRIRKVVFPILGILFRARRQRTLRQRRETRLVAHGPRAGESL